MATQPLTQEDRAAIAREAVKEIIEWLDAIGEAPKEVITRLRDHGNERYDLHLAYPAEPEPETVMVDGVTYTHGLAGWAANTEPGFLFTGRFSTFLHRIAAARAQLAEAQADLAAVRKVENWRDSEGNHVTSYTGLWAAIHMPRGASVSRCVAKGETIIALGRALAALEETNA